MKRLIWLVACAAVLWAQVPSQDIRNTYIPNTDTHFTMPEYKSLAEWEARKAHLRKQILSAAGLLPMPEKTPLEPQIFGRIENQDYSIEKVLLQTLPGYYLGGNLYRPLGKKGRFPGVASPHGHWNYGRLEHQPLGSIPARCINLARQGYVVFAYDMVGYDDTIQTPHAFGGPAEQLWSFGPLGLQLWNSTRAVDFLQSLPDVDPERTAIMQGGSPCENAPGLRVGAFNVEFGAMMAPRFLLMVSATGDWTRNTPREEFPAIRHIYELYGKPDNVETIQIDAPHNYNQASREAVYRFFGKHILGDTNQKRFAERNIRVERLQDMLALHNRTLPANALTYQALFEQWTAAARRQAAAADSSALRERLAYVLGAEWPAEVLSSGDHEGAVVLGRPGKGDRVPGLWVPGSAAGAVLVVHPEGAAQARQAPAVRELIQAKRPVLMIDAFQTGSATAARDRSHRYFLTFNRSEDACRVQDILTALKFLSGQQAGQIQMIGLGRAGVWALFAAAVAPIKVKLSVDLASFAGRDQDFIERFFVPGIQRVGGLEAAQKLTGLRQ
jgi:hypothetical protein